MSHSIFSSDEIAIITQVGTACTFQPGHLIYMEGDPANVIYYLQRGRVRVFQNIASGREVTLDVVEAGHIVGESAFYPNTLRPTCIQAVNEVQAVAFRLADLLPHLQTQPTLMIHLLQQCSSTIDRLCLRHQEQCLLDRYGKVASFILDITASDSPVRDTRHGNLPYTHEHIADSLGLSRPTVTAVLRHFEERGWIRNGYRHVQVTDRPALENFVQQQKDQQ